jgi:hypothetical protein
MSAATFEPGLRLIEQGRCPLGCVHPMACWTCPVGHATECHHPHTCEEARCGHLQQETTEEEFDDLSTEFARDYEHAEEQRQLRIWAGKEHACRVCGCSESRACSGGCIWAEPDLCSRCARATSAMARDWSGGAV